MTLWHWLAMGGGMVLGFLAGALAASLKWGRLRTDAAAQSARAEELSRQVSRLESLLSEAQAGSTGLTAALSAANAENSHLRQQMESEAGRIVELQAKMKLEFENLASRLLEEKSAKFLDQNQSHLSALLAPFRERLGEFRERMELIHNEEEKSAAALGMQLKSLHDLNRKMAEEAGNLTSALKGQAKTQGTWGELVLEKILEKCGLTKGVEYETQASYQEEGGGRRMPDVVIHLPEGKNLIIDAKVSLTGYERAVNSDDAASRTVALREHVTSVRRHVDELAKKDYPGLQDLRSPDFVLMFVPVEPALHLALQEDPALYSDAFEKNVILVSSSTLLIALRAVESVWRHHKQTLNAQEIARQAGNLHDAFVLFTQALEEVGSRLDQAKASYDLALSRLASGRGNLVKRTQDLQKLGARAEKQISPALARLAEE